MKTAMIWGAAGGIGGSLAKQLADEKWRVIGVARNSSALDPQIQIPLSADVSRFHDIEQAVLAASFETESINLWVYAVGDIVADRIHEQAPASWGQIMAANLGGAHAATYASLPLLAEDAHLFYLGAQSERLRLPGLAAYASAKAGLEAFAATLAKEQRRRHVTVIRPGAVATPFWDKVPLRLPKNALAPEAVASRILSAFNASESGQIDL